MKKYTYVALIIALIYVAQYRNVSIDGILEQILFSDNGNDIDRYLHKKQQQNDQVVHVAHIVDGDTFDLSTGDRVRMIGIDTPERGRLFYADASDHLAALILDKDVILVKDISETDRYGRLLRHVYVGDNWINKQMIEDGFARLSTYPPDVAHVDIFRGAEYFAREQKKGIWSVDENRVYEKK